MGKGNKHKLSFPSTKRRQNFLSCPGITTNENTISPFDFSAAKLKTFSVFFCVDSRSERHDSVQGVLGAPCQGAMVPPRQRLRPHGLGGLGLGLGGLQEDTRGRGGGGGGRGSGRRRGGGAAGTGHAAPAGDDGVGHGDTGN